MDRCSPKTITLLPQFEPLAKLILYAYPVHDVHDLNLEFCPSIGIYTLFPSLSQTWIVVLDNCLMCCCYGLRTSLLEQLEKSIIGVKRGTNGARNVYVCCVSPFHWIRRNRNSLPAVGMR